MLVSRQIVYATCDIDGCKNRKLLFRGFLSPNAAPYMAHVPEGWRQIENKIICPDHDIRLTVDNKSF